MIKGALFDIDDTLYSHKDKCVPELTLKLLDELKQKGIKIGICTSRLPAEMSSVPQELWDKVDCKIMGTGSTTMVERKYYKVYSIAKETLNKYMSYFKENNISYCYSDVNGDLFFWGDLSLVLDGHILSWAKRKVMFKEFEDEEVSNIFYYLVTPKQEEYIKSINPNAIISTWGDCGNISASYVDKSFGVLKFCQVYGFTTDEVVAAGDGFNDDIMLEMAGIGIAVENAKENTKKAANYICHQPIEEGGLYYAFKDLKII